MILNRFILFSILITASFYFIFTSFNFNSYSPVNINFSADIRTCGTMDYHNSLMQQDPGYKIRFEEMENFVRNFSEQKKGKDNPVIVTIPVVVHVVYNTQAQNVSMDQIQSQIDVLNRDFRRLNSDTINTPAPFKQFGADAQLEFCLAKRDPAGNPSFGVTRTQTNIQAFGLNSALKFTSQGGHDAWPNDKYLNIWVCNLGAGLLGYATFPGGSPQFDGVAITFNAFGTIGAASPPFNKGRTATHEIGHWLALYHIWGDDNGACWGTDQVDDTPNQGPEYYGCPGYPQITCDNQPNGGMFMNYMDYTDDACMNIFTLGQSDRMTAVMNGIRFPLTYSRSCMDTSGVPLCEFNADSLIIPFGRDVQFSDKSAGIPTAWNWTFAGGNPAASSVQNPNIIYPNPGVYNVKLKITNAHGSDSLVKNNYIRVLGAQMSAFNLITPVNFHTINVASGDTTKYLFNWTRTSLHPSIRYNLKLKKIPGANPEFLFTSGNSGVDSSIMLTGHFLDSIAKVMNGQNYDSARCSWRATAYNGLDSLASNTFLLTIKRGLIKVNQISTSVPGEFKLYNSFPNPFNPETRIKFDIPKNVNVNISVYDIKGSLVEVLHNGQVSPGTYDISWNASGYSSGVYFIRMNASTFTDIKKVLLVK